jgi:hypothetical protein
MVMGYRVDVHIPKGWVRISGAMLHDHTGKTWPKCSLLFSPFQKKGISIDDPPKEARWFYGRAYDLSKGSVHIPPRALSTWSRVDASDNIQYTRPGTRAPGDYEHLFGKRRWQALYRKGKLPTLYRLGRLYRLELGSGCIVDDRGIVSP